MKLRYVGANTNRAHIFSDPIQRYYVKTVEFLTPISQVTRVECQGDLCIGDDGSRYVPTTNPEIADKMGLPTGAAMNEGGYGFNQPREEPASSQKNNPGTSFPGPTKENESRKHHFTFQEEQAQTPTQGKGKEKEVVWEMYHQIEVV